MDISDAHISTSAGASGTRDIYLPNQDKDVDIIALDIGGSLAKVIYFSRKRIEGEPEDALTGGRLHFERFTTQPIDNCLTFVTKIIEENRRAGQQLIIKATGGGAHKYSQDFQQRLGVTLQPFDEMRCLIVGLNFLLREVPYEVFTIPANEGPLHFQELPRQDSMFPYLLVNIGSGVSILKITSETTFQRVSGTSLGGGTLWGLLSLLTDCKDFDEMLTLSTQGDNRNVDMLVGDIYGMDYGSIGLKSTTIASSFGKCFQRPGSAPKESFKAADICKSVLLMLSNNIGQIAYLNATVHNVSRIYFGGSFIRGHLDTMRTIAFAIDFWSKGAMQANFLRHDGYIGALGAFLIHEPTGEAQAVVPGSFMENFARSQTISDKAPGSLGVLDSMRDNLVPFPLLADLNGYNPDTLDLVNPEKRTHWLKTFEESLDSIVKLVWVSLGDGVDVKKGTDDFLAAFRTFLNRLRTEPGAFGQLSVRSLLDVREQCLHEYIARDPLKQLKHRENTTALRLLPERLKLLEAMDEDSKQRALVTGLLAGNMYDWGARDLLEDLQSGKLNFDAAIQKVRRGHKQYDLSEKLFDRLKEGKIHVKAVIFVDNCGPDIVLGIIPFALYLLKRGTGVVLACNSMPALNDITYGEMLSLAGAISDFSPEFKDAYTSGRLSVCATGQGSPCLNLARVNSTLANAAKDADFVILQGMGRSIQTNLRAKFKCDSLKIAVIKTPFVAEELGAELYDALCLFESPPLSSS